MRQPSQAERRKLDPTLWCVAVGVPLGRWVDPHGDALSGVLIRQGGSFLVAKPSELELFVSALSPKLVADLLEIARDAGADDPAGLLEDMVEQGLLVVLGDSPRADRETLRHLRLQTAGLGMGNNHEHPELFLIVAHPTHGQPHELLECDALLYSVWAASDGRTLGEVADTLSGSFGTDADAVLDHVLVALPTLLIAGVAFLDAAPGWEPS